MVFPGTLAVATRDALAGSVHDDPDAVRALLTQVRKEQKVSQGDLMYALRMALSGTTVCLWPVAALHPLTAFHLHRLDPPSSIY